MKKLVSGMFSSVPDAQLLLATSGYEEEAPENAPDMFSASGLEAGQNRTEINSSAAASSQPNETTNNTIDESLS